MIVADCMCVIGGGQQCLNECLCLCRKIQDQDAHIERLEKEISELRDKYSQLQDQSKSDECKLNTGCCLLMVNVDRECFVTYLAIGEQRWKCIIVETGSSIFQRGVDSNSV